MKKNLFLILIFLLFSNSCANQILIEEQNNKKKFVGKPTHVRGIHLSAWTAGMEKYKSRFKPYLGRDRLNTIVIAVKEYEGEVYLPLNNKELIINKYNTPIKPIPRIKEYLEELKSYEVYTIARIVVFKDNYLARNFPHLAVKNPDGSLWKDYKGNSWTDPYNKEVWNYNIEIAKAAIELGFEEIQFDYIRFPSDGNTKMCRYSNKEHNSQTATSTLVEFLKFSKQNITTGYISIDVFGLTPSVDHDMGIGQRFLQMAEVVDFISPMMYPSHYRKGEYNLPDPNKEPYKTVYITVVNAKKLLKENSHKLRPYLQDFSLGYKYGVKEVVDQIKACYDNDIFDWLLWDPKCQYTLAAIEEMVKFNSQNYKLSISSSSNNF